MSARAGWTGRGLVYRAYQRRIRAQIAATPRHVAMIVDGNRRWAKQLGLETAAHGHRAGAAKIPEFLGWCDDLGVQVVTLYLLSADNLTGRHSDELRQLTGIIAELAANLAAHPTWRVQHVGSNEGLPPELVRALEGAEAETAEHSGLHVNLAVGYGGRREIADAMRSIVRAHGAGGGTLDDLAEVLTPELIGDHLYTQGQPDPDLVIRTSGEQRLSDFMLWQSAHSEFYFVEAFYPDLREVDFLRAVRDFGRRSRRFGG
ncbi:isoprenyl transferase [Curtobacterium sp. MCBD17_034]|uniref:isoprenyl transferase n=1 Tax=unclassified Curtobacterium TaxID=257496 RepID=UPI000DA9570A|nr:MULTISPECIES: isoprenyl transferase [unclassified Curtobacterium]PZF58026.1 isoprenyl transferase [Curtobacterium sp. MCBD17_034]PZM33218.1 isoprenyl transferase [Curtobacterium sp. MCBD17_031]